MQNSNDTFKLPDFARAELDPERLRRVGHALPARLLQYPG